MQTEENKSLFHWVHCFVPCVLSCYLSKMNAIIVNCVAWSGLNSCRNTVYDPCKILQVLCWIVAEIGWCQEWIHIKLRSVQALVLWGCCGSVNAALYPFSIWMFQLGSNTGAWHSQHLRFRFGPEGPQSKLSKLKQMTYHDLSWSMVEAVHQKVKRVNWVKHILSVQTPWRLWKPEHNATRNHVA